MHGLLSSAVQNPTHRKSGATSTSKRHWKPANLTSTSSTPVNPSQHYPLHHTPLQCLYRDNHYCARRRPPPVPSHKPPLRYHRLRPGGSPPQPRECLATTMATIRRLDGYGALIRARSRRRRAGRVSGTLGFLGAWVWRPWRMRLSRILREWAFLLFVGGYTRKLHRKEMGGGGIGLEL